ncbi:MAG: ATP-dependent zinc metalloprotease FtsH [Planctomycetota bacterium]
MSDGDTSKDPQQQQDQPAPQRWTQRAWLWFAVLMIFVWLVFAYLQNQAALAPEIDTVRFGVQLQADNIKSLTQEEERLYLIDFRTKVTGAELKSEGDLRQLPDDKLYEKAHIVFPERELSANWSKQFSEKNIPIYYQKFSNQVLWMFLFNLLPIILLIGIFWYMTTRVRRQMGPGIFGKFTGNRAKRYERGPQAETFEDVAGLKNVKTELMEVVEFLKDPERFTQIGAKIPKGVLLVGPPGTGKTLMARAIAGEAGVPFFSISGSEFIELFVGVGAARVRELFDEAKKNSPCIIFIDEIDAVGRSRGAGLGGGHDEREQTLNQILSEMDGFEANQAVIVVAATNRPDVLDPALVRPGRFDRQVTVERPQRDGRRAILEVHTRKIPLGADVDLDDVARGTIGFSGADLQNLANEAALMAARHGQTEVSAEDFAQAKDKILLGTRRDEAMNERERRITAYHEAGHALLALLLPQADPVHSVTIIPRGRALGVTQQLPIEEIYNYSKTYLIHRVIVLLGGRAAEELTFKEFTTGAENDLQQVTDLAERMVCRWGMSEKLGPISLRRAEEHVFLGRELGEQKHFSEHTSMLIDDEIRHLIENAYTRAMELLESESDRLELLAKELLEKETLTDVELYKLLDFPMPEAPGDDEEQGVA